MDDTGDGGSHERSLNAYSDIIGYVIAVLVCVIVFLGALSIYTSSRGVQEEAKTADSAAVISKVEEYEEGSETTVIDVGALAVTDPATHLVFNVPPRVIDQLTIPDVVPAEGKIIVANLKTKQIELFEDATSTGIYPILTIGRPGTPWETPAGLYSIHTKEAVHFSSIGHVYMPYSMEFYGNYFIHGETYYPDGTPTSALFSGGCIKLATEDAEAVFDFAEIGTPVFVYDPKQEDADDSLALALLPAPPLTASAYLVADLSTGDAYLEKNAQSSLPIGSLTKLMTGLVANETISFKRHIALTHNDDEGEPLDDAKGKLFLVEDLMYPLLLSSSEAAAASLANFIGKKTFVRWMNNAAQAFGMNDTSFSDALGTSTENVSTPDDLFRLAHYLTHKKSFIFDITREASKDITAIDETQYAIENRNAPVFIEPFAGGKVSTFEGSGESMVSRVELSGDDARQVVVIVLDARDSRGDTQALVDWLQKSVEEGRGLSDAACVSCRPTPYRKIVLP